MKYVYELVDGAGQSTAVYDNKEAAEAHAADEPGLDVVETEVWGDYVPGRVPAWISEMHARWEKERAAR